MLMESLALLLYKNLNITWVAVCEEQMHSLLFRKAYQGQATEKSNKDVQLLYHRHAYSLQ